MNGLCDTDILSLASCEQLTYCNLSMSKEITDHSLIVLASNCHRLSTVVLSMLQNITIVSITALSTQCPLEDFSFVNMSMQMAVPLEAILPNLQAHCASTIRRIRIEDIRFATDHLVTYDSIVDLLTTCKKMQTLHLGLVLTRSQMYALRSSFPTITFIFE